MDAVLFDGPKVIDCGSFIAGAPRTPCPGQSGKARDVRQGASAVGRCRRCASSPPPAHHEGQLLHFMYRPPSRLRSGAEASHGLQIAPKQ